jgi:hypothetical protein
MNRREFLKFLGGAAATAAVAPAALAEALKTEVQGPIGVPGPIGPPGNLAPGFIVLEPGMSVQQAIDALPVSGGTVYVPNGTWIVDQTIEIRKDVQLVAQGNLVMEGCYITAKDSTGSPFWILMEEDDQVVINNNRFLCRESFFHMPIGEELERVKEKLFRLYLKFKKLVV